MPTQDETNFCNVPQLLSCLPNAALPVWLHSSFLCLGDQFVRGKIKYTCQQGDPAKTSNDHAVAWANMLHAINAPSVQKQNIVLQGLMDKHGSHLGSTKN